MAAAMSLELALYSSWKAQMLREGARHIEIQEVLDKGKPNGPLPKGLGIGLPKARSDFVPQMATRHCGEDGRGAIINSPS